MILLGSHCAYVSHSVCFVYAIPQNFPTWRADHITEFAEFAVQYNTETTNAYLRKS